MKSYAPLLITQPSSLITHLSAPQAFVPTEDKTERRMVLVQWLIMPLVLAGCLLPPPRPHEAVTYAITAAAIMALHPLLYLLVGRLPDMRPTVRDLALTATDVTVATLVFYATAARPGYAQVLLYCAVALAATRYPLYRAFGIASLIALLLVFAALLPLHVALPALTSEIMGLYALTGLVGLLSQTEKAVALAAVENGQLAETVMRRNRELGALNRLSRTLNTEASGRDVLRVGLAGVVEALELRSARAYLVENGELHLVMATGEEGESVAAAEWRVREARRVLATARTTTTGWEAPDGTALPAPGVLWVSVPLLVRGAVGAIVQADLVPGVKTTTAMLETLEVFCGELAIALENALLRGEAHRSAILHEKNRIAQELHDTVLQMLFSIGLRLQWSLERLPHDSALCDPLAEARHLSARAGEELRGAIFTLSSDIAEVGLAAAVERLVEDQAAKAGWSANVVISGVVPDLPVLVQNAAHRVVREALMNAYKHAQATEVMVSMRFTSTLLTIVVQDNGVGISSEARDTFRQTPDHFGLRTVAEQVEGLGGEFTIYNNDDEPGATARATIPVTSG